MSFKNNFKTVRALFIPIFIMSFALLPLLFILIKHYFTFDLFILGLFNSFIISGGMLLNIFLFFESSEYLKVQIKYTVIVIISIGLSIFALFTLLIKEPLFFLYGLDVVTSYFFIIFIIITSLSLYSCAFYNFKQKSEMELELREKIEREMYSSKFNPHFLFNSLNLMVSLLDDKERAEEVLIQLSELLRYNLDASKKVSVKLSDEISSIKRYIFIQKQRFGNRLNFEITGETEGNIPPLLLQPIIENSLKHNLEIVDFLKITIDIIKHKNILKITLIDSEKKLTKEMIGQGSGIEITKKLTELNNGSFEISNGGITICLPQ